MRLDDNKFQVWVDRKLSVFFSARSCVAQLDLKCSQVREDNGWVRHRHVRVESNEGETRPVFRSEGEIQVA